MAICFTSNKFFITWIFHYFHNGFLKFKFSNSKKYVRIVHSKFQLANVSSLYVTKGSMSIMPTCLNTWQNKNIHTRSEGKIYNNWKESERARVREKLLLNIKWTYHSCTVLHTQPYCKIWMRAKHNTQRIAMRTEQKLIKSAYGKINWRAFNSFHIFSIWLAFYHSSSWEKEQQVENF